MIEFLKKDLRTIKNEGVSDWYPGTFTGGVIGGYSLNDQSQVYV